MRVGDIVEVDGVRATVLGSSDICFLDFQEIKSKKKRWIGVSPYCGNPRVVVIKRSKSGARVLTAEWHA